MNLVRRIRIALLALTCLSGLAWAAGQKEAAGTATATDAMYAPFGRYDQPVTINMGRWNTAEPNLPKGESVSDNKYLTYIQQKMNIIVKYAFLTDTDYTQKVNLVIASGDLPDAMHVTDLNQLQQLVSAGLVADLTTVMQKTLAPLLRERYDSYGDRKYQTAVYNGKLMAIPNLNIGYQFGMTWARRDWIAKVGGSEPKTFDDIVNLAKAFVRNNLGGDGTIGFTMGARIAGDYNSVTGLDPLFNMYNSYPRQWLKDASGKVTYGTITPETKLVLGKLRQMYADGIIDKEFATRNDTVALYAAGKAGLAFGPWWIAYWPLADSVKNDQNADWFVYRAPVDAQGKFHAYTQNPHTEWVVVRKDYAHPEVVVKLLNQQITAVRRLDTAAVALYADAAMEPNWTVWPMPLQIEFEDAVVRISRELLKAWNARDKSLLDNVTGTTPVEEKNMYDRMLANSQNPRKDVQNWAEATARFYGMGLADAPNIVYANNVFPGVTKTMETKWATLEKLENEIMIKVIMGEVPLDAFDQFVTQWKQFGGDDITKEVEQRVNQK